MNLLELFLGQIPEAIFLAWFMIFAKALQKKRILFTILMTIDYLLWMTLFPYNWYFHIGLMAVTFLILKVLYREKSQVTDIFILLIAYIILGITSAICFMICGKNALIAAILNRVIIFGFLLIYRNRLNRIQDWYKKFWNRDDKPKAIKSTTFRGLNIVIFNTIFVLLNACMVYALYLVKTGGG